MATQVSYKALLWLNNMNRTVRSEIEAAFGHLPLLDPVEEDWFDSPDGPAWLWWLIAILPLRSEIKVQKILSQTSYFRHLFKFFFCLVFCTLLARSVEKHCVTNVLRENYKHVLMTGNSAMLQN